MLPGPVFTFEMIITSRRGRFYATRAMYAVVLLLILWTVHSAWSSAEGGIIPAEMMPWFGLSAFGSVAVGQEILVLVLTPALVAGAIADEKRRKTLHYLLASQLTGPEIVLGKLMVRMLYLVVLLGVSVPVLSLLVLIGGVDPILVVLGVGATLSTAWFLATLSIWVSTIARHPREALFAAYGLETLWLLLPWVLRNVSWTGNLAFDSAIVGLADWIGASSPVETIRELVFGGFLPGRDRLAPMYGMIGIQTALGAGLAGLAAVQLRPIFRRQDDAPRRRGLRAWLSARRARKHPPIGDRPMLWKELQTSRPGGLARGVGWLLTLVLGGLLLYNGVWLFLSAFVEMWDYGYTPPMVSRFVPSQIGSLDRWYFLSFLQFVIPFIYLLGILIVAGSAAAAITAEHEDDTWVSLTATDVTGREIVLAKLLGAVRRGARLGSMIVLLLIGGVITGAIHWASVPTLVVAVGVYAWFASALGLWISMFLRSIWRAQFLTIGLLLLVNVSGQGVLNVLSKYGFASLAGPGFTPYEVGKLIMDPHFFRRFYSTQWPPFWRLWDVDDGPAWMAIFSIMSLVIYSGLAAVLTWDAIRRFEVVAGRAFRSDRAREFEAGTPPVSPGSLTSATRLADEEA